MARRCGYVIGTLRSLDAQNVVLFLCEQMFDLAATVAWPDLSTAPTCPRGQVRCGRDDKKVLNSVEVTGVLAWP